MKPLPHSAESEQQVLGSLLIGTNEEIDLIFGRLEAKDFYSKRNATIFECCHDLFSRGEQLDIIAVRNILSDDSTAEYVLRLADKMISSANAEFHANIVKDFSDKRRFIEVSNTAINNAYDPAMSARDIISDQDDELFRLANHGRMSEYMAIKDISLKGISKLEESYNSHSGVTGVPSFYGDLDSITAGFQPSNMIILAARPSVGKTALALNMAHNMAMHGHPVGFFSLEMSAIEVWRRLASLHSSINGTKIMSGHVSEEELTKIINSNLHSLPIFIDDSSGINVSAIRTKARLMVRKEHIDMLFIDYIGMIDGDGKFQNKNAELTHISARLKALAKELNIPIMVLSQMSRESTRLNLRPRLIDLRESGAIEQDADMVLFIYRPGFSEQKPKDGAAEVDESQTEILIEKHRNGQTGKIDMHFEGKYCKFTGVEPRYAERSEPYKESF